MLISLLLLSAASGSTWFCEEGASEKSGPTITACGVDLGATENEARKKALAAAFEELDAICDRSADCKSFELEIEPLRSDCRKQGAQYKCYRAVRATITGKKREASFVRGETLRPEREKIEVTVRVEGDGLKGAVIKAEPKCATDLSALNSALLDLSTSVKQAAMATAATAIPFDPACAGVHYKVISTLYRAGLSVPAYTAFLLKTLESIEDPTADERAYSVLEYLQKLGPLSDAEWRVALDVVKRTPTHSLYRMMPRLFADQATGAQQKVEKQRVDAFVAAVKKGEVGRPLPLKMDDAMELLLRSLRSYRTRAQPWLAVYAYDRHRDGLVLDNPPKIIKSLKALYDGAEDPSAKTQANEWIADVVKKVDPSREIGKELASYLEEFGRDIQKQDDEEDEGVRKIALLKKLRSELISRSGANLGRSLAIVEQDYERKARTMLCLDLAISCGDLVPDTERLSKLLKSKKSQKRIEALDVLGKLPKTAAALETDLVQNLRDVDQGTIDNWRTVLEKTVGALASIPTRNADALKLMVDLHLRSLLSFQDVRGQLGAGVEPYLLKELQSPNQRHHLAILMELTEFQRLGKATCKHLESLRKQAKELHYSVVDQAEKALRRCP
jgi:hypothetical protein